MMAWFKSKQGPDAEAVAVERGTQVPQPPARGFTPSAGGESYASGSQPFDNHPAYGSAQGYGTPGGSQNASGYESGGYAAAPVGGYDAARGSRVSDAGYGAPQQGYGAGQYVAGAAQSGYGADSNGYQDQTSGGYGAYADATQGGYQGGYGNDTAGQYQGDYQPNGYDQTGAQGGQNSYQDSGYDSQSGVGQGGYKQGGYEQGGYQDNGQNGGYQDGGYGPSGYQQGSYDQGGYQQGGYEQSGSDSYDRGGQDAGYGSYDAGAQSGYTADTYAAKQSGPATSEANTSPAGARNQMPAGLSANPGDYAPGSVRRARLNQPQEQAADASYDTGGYGGYGGTQSEYSGPGGYSQPRGGGSFGGGGFNNPSAGQDTYYR